jgi:hypothetical protein
VTTIKMPFGAHVKVEDGQLKYGTRTKTVALSPGFHAEAQCSGVFGKFGMITVTGPDAFLLTRRFDAKSVLATRAAQRFVVEFNAYVATLSWTPVAEIPPPAAGWFDHNGELTYYDGTVWTSVTASNYAKG